MQNNFTKLSHISNNKQQTIRSNANNNKIIINKSNKLKYINKKQKVPHKSLYSTMKLHKEKTQSGQSSIGEIAQGTKKQKKTQPHN
jgi:hypothetical protein